MDGWKYWENKKVFTILKNKRNYSGTILEVEKNGEVYWITLLDKFNNRIGFSSDEVEVIQEEGK